MEIFKKPAAGNGKYLLLIKASPHPDFLPALDPVRECPGESPLATASTGPWPVISCRQYPPGN